jgi:hypothetical protein
MLFALHKLLASPPHTHLKSALGCGLGLPPRIPYTASLLPQQRSRKMPPLCFHLRCLCVRMTKGGWVECEGM